MKFLRTAALAVLGFCGVIQATAVFDGDAVSSAPSAEGQKMISAALAPEVPTSGASVASQLPASVASRVFGDNAPKSKAIFDSENVGSRHGMDVTKPLASQIASAHPSVIRAVAADAAKPRVAQAFIPHLLEFKENPPAPSCDEVNDRLSKNEATVRAHVQLTVILACLDDDMFKSSEMAVSRDKNAALSLNSLATEMINESGSGGDLINYMDSIVVCKVPPLEDNRTILQRILEKGMEKSLKTSVANSLLRGNNYYDPALMLDAYGNTLMHLAVYSGGWNMPKTLFALEEAKNVELPERRMNGTYWMISTLLKRNKAGKLPLELASSTSMRDQMKQNFRSYAMFLKIQGQKFGVDDTTMREVEDLLKSSTSVPRPGNLAGLIGSRPAVNMSRMPAYANTLPAAAAAA